MHLHLNQCVKNNQWQKERHEEVNCKYQQADEGRTERERESAECKRKSETSEGASTNLQPVFNQPFRTFTNRTPLLPLEINQLRIKGKLQTEPTTLIIVENRPLFMPDVKIGRIATFVEGRSYPDLI